MPIATDIPLHEIDFTLPHTHDHETCNLMKKAIDKFTSRYDHGYYAPTPPPAPTYFAPTATSSLTNLDPLQILATLAFVAFLLNTLLALIDRITMTTRVVIARSARKYDKTDKAEEVNDAIKKFRMKKWPEENNTI